MTIHPIFKYKRIVSHEGGTDISAQFSAGFFDGRRDEAGFGGELQSAEFLRGSTAADLGKVQSHYLRQR